ncbi:peptidase M16 [Salinibacter sp. 10B]|nr:peptidase M16 [Salinibacter sp. 10B]
MSMDSSGARASSVVRWFGTLALLLLLAVPSAQGQDLLSQFEEKVTTFTLDNGLTFVVIERHDAPVVSFHTYADVGSVNEPAGRTGLAHMFEHMAFKGTTSIGTTNIEKEIDALQRQEEIYLQLRREKAKGAQADSARIAKLQQEFKAAQKEAESYIQEGEYENILEREGVTGMNAYTTPDATGYMYNLPANKLELFFAMESDRFHNPVLREFYTERDVVMEERRQRTESSPTGRLIEEFLTTAFKAHPYGQPTIGHMSDLQNLSRTDAKQFFDKYYGANNLTIGIAGDVNPDRVQTLANEYFSRLPEGEDPLPVTTREPEQIGERRVTIREQTQPFVLIGYHRGSMHSANDPVYDILVDVLSRGRTSRLHQALVETETALNVQVVPSFPGSKHETLFGIFGVPNRGVSPDTVEHMIYDELDRITNEGITQAELERAKTRARADLIGSLDSNSGLARQFSQMEALTGDWRSIFRQLDALEKVTVDDVQRVAKNTFTRSNRTVALIKTTDSSGDPTTAEK